MTSSDHFYVVDQRLTGNGIQYLFISDGVREIIKIIEYILSNQVDGRPVYNLGFGDYDSSNECLLDSPISNNGDHYRVFNTVLNTIPDFFTSFPTAIVAVQGSDSGDAFIRQCRHECKKGCKEGECRRAGRRIGLYCSYLNKHFEAFSNEYIFYGGNVDDENRLLIEPYKIGKQYDSVLLSKNQ
ncbi:MAG TPA: hypothetical protein VL547_16905 [Dinghuibacter sp.]|uniref:DUF6934 family protein n=1 Tax=Dinghuibacter sp. TaxID=2024697 RepID=UPI002BE4B901|nr:hypothetical protein [Dinghuibacter sp.]HTJ13720.1 hypothetical protein [Dinghuibacter sp.]